MIGDAFAKGKVKSTTDAGPVFKKKNSKGKSYKTVDGMRTSDGGGDDEDAAVAKRSTKGMRVGTGVEDPAKMFDSVKNMRNAGKSFKTITPRNNDSDSGSHVDEWCKGKRASYK